MGEEKVVNTVVGFRQADLNISQAVDLLAFSFHTAISRVYRFISKDENWQQVTSEFRGECAGRLEAIQR